MYQATAIEPSSQSIFYAGKTQLLRKILLVSFGVLVLIAANQLNVTFQTTVAIFIGMTYGTRLSMSTLLIYLMIVAYSGLAQFTGPTGGYLIGLIPAALVSGYLAQLGYAHNIIVSFFIASIGTAINFLFGLLLLARFVGWHGAFLFGCVPFVLSILIQLLMLAFIVPKCWKKR